MKMKCKLVKMLGAFVIAISTFISNAVAVSTGRFVGTFYGVTEPEPKFSIVNILLQIGSIIVIPIVLIIGIIVFIKKKKNKD